MRGDGDAFGFGEMNVLEFELGDFWNPIVAVFEIYFLIQVWVASFRRENVER